MKTPEKRNGPENGVRRPRDPKMQQNIKAGERRPLPENGKAPNRQPALNKNSVPSGNTPSNDRQKNDIPRQNHVNAQGSGRRAQRNFGAQAQRQPEKASDLNNNLRSQTPLNRRMRQKNAPAEPGTVRRNQTQYFKVKEHGEKKKKVKRSPSLFLRRALLVLIFYAILMPISLLLFRLWLPFHTTPETNDYIYQVGPDNNVLSKKTYKWSTVRSGDTFYLDMTGLAELCEMTTTGDDKSIKYTVRASGESVEFVLGQSLAYVNGIPDRMDGVSYIDGDKHYAPMDFVNRCFIGITASLDTESNKITVIRETKPTGDYVNVTFPQKETVLTESIDFNSLDSAIREEILLREELMNKPQPDPNEPTPAPEDAD